MLGGSGRQPAMLKVSKPQRRKKKVDVELVEEEDGI